METIAINHDWVYNLTCILSPNIHAISKVFITFDYLFELITNVRFSYNSFRFMKHHKILFSYIRGSFDCVSFVSSSDLVPLFIVLNVVKECYVCSLTI